MPFWGDCEQISVKEGQKRKKYLTNRKKVV